MNNYIRLLNNVVQEIIPEIDVAIPNVPITERYTEEFLNKCVVTTDDVEVKQNWDYIPNTGEFKPPIELFAERYIIAGVSTNKEIEIKFNVDGEFIAESSQIEIIVIDNVIAFTAPANVGIYEIGINFVANDTRMLSSKIVLETIDSGD